MIVLILILSFGLVLPFEATRTEISRYLDLMLPYVYYDSIYLEQNGIFLDKERLMNEVNEEIIRYFADFDRVESVKTFYTFDDLALSFSLHYVHFYRSFSIAKEIAADEKR